MIIKSEIAGQIWKTVVRVGQELAIDDTIVIIESMKMEIPVASPIAGIVTELHVKEGELVMEDQEIATLEVLRASE
ncbi:MAG: biotin/lipoyl-binding protein [Cellvibrionales bacterium TMED148]|nr:acetyl-CoA carboxylase biotin carboxyl carrier protein subunit [Porticoccaceae bacterium]RPG90891.1 MAG: biotin/lipoyl-binding protein [Cellvibrionales bacterium TMED148]